LQSVAHEVDVEAQIINVIGIACADPGAVDAIFDLIEPVEIATEAGSGLLFALPDV
jgi:hypothetical protein